MATEVKRRRGTTAQHLDFIGAEAEITVDIEKYTLLVHDDSGTKPTGHELLRADFSNIPTSVTADVTIVGEVDATKFSGDLTGAIHVQGKNATSGTLTKGTPVYISGQVGAGQQFTIAVADADDSAKMPCIGILAADVNNNAQGDIVTHGKLIGIDTSSFTVGDELYISSSGTLVSTPPTGESNLLQKIAKVIRVDSSDGQIYIMGAGRTNAVPNLNQDKIFLGDSNNQAVATALSSINLSSFNDDVVSGSYLPLTGGTISSDLTISGNLTVSGTTTTVNSETINLADNFILLNSNHTGDSPTENAGIEIKRSTDNSANKKFFWNETTDQWNADSALVATSFIKQSNSGGFLKADGTEDTSTYLTTVTEAAVLAHADNYANWTLTVGATNQDIGSGDALTLTAGTGISLSISGANVTIDSTISDGDITAVNTQSNSGLSGGSTSGDIDLSLDISNLTAITTADSQDPIAILDGSTTKKITLGNIPISAFNDDSTFLKDADFTSNGFLKRTGDGTYAVDTNTYLTSETSHSDVVVDGDFTTAGFMKTDGSGTYSVDNSTFLTSVSSSDVTQHLSVVTQSAAGGGELSLVNGEFRFKPAAIPTGFITAVNTSATSGLSGGASSGDVSLTLDASALTADTTLTSTDVFIIGQTGATKKIAAFNIDLSLLDNSTSGFTNNVGTITGVTGGAGLDGSGTSGTVTLSHSDTSSQSSVNNSGVSVIQDVTLDTYGHVTGLASKDLVDEFVPDKANLVLQNPANGGGSLSYNQTNKQFEYTPPAAATGDITEIATNANSGLNGGTTSGVATLSFNISNLVDMTEDVAAIDEIAILDGTDNKRKPLGEIDISVFNNDAGFGTGDITGVTAGAGLSGGGTSGAVTLSHSDTSSQASVDNSNGSVIQDVTLDTYGHVTGLASANLDDRYLKLSGGTLTGSLTVQSVTAISTSAPKFQLKESDTTDENKEILLSGGDFFIRNLNDDGTVPSGENILKISHEGVVTLLAQGTTTATNLNALFQDGNGVLKRRTLGSNAFNSTAFLTSSSFTVADDDTNTTNVATNGSLTISGGTGIDVAVTTGTVTITSTVTDTDTNTFVNAASFNTGDGVLTLTKNNSSTVTADLDGRYLQLSGGSLTGVLDFNNVSGRAITITADTYLDGRDASIYLGNATSNYGWDLQYQGTGSGNNNKLRFVSTNDGTPKVAFEATQDGIVNLPQSGATVNSSTIWHAGNDGSGSGLDADTLDGQHASAFLTSVPSEYLTQTEGDARYLQLSGGALTGATSITTSTNRVLTLDYTGAGSYTLMSFKQSGTEQFRLWGSNTDNYLSFYNDQSNGHQLTLASDGNVGIGTNSPNGKVTVFDDMISTSSSTTEINIGQNTYGSINFQGDNQGSGDSGTKQQGITWQVNDYNNTTDYGVQAAIAVSNNGSIGTQMGFFTSSSYSGGPDERIRITAAGNVGINNTNPSSSYKLDVNGAGHFVNDLILDEDLVVDDTLYVGNTNAGSHKLYVEGGASHDVVAKFKTTGTGVGDYSEIHIENNAGNRTILGSIGSAYTNADWSNSSYLYNTGSGRRFLIKSIGEMIFTTGGYSIANDKVITLTSGGQINMHNALKLESVAQDTSSTSALVYATDGTQTVKYRTLGSNAFNSTTIPTNNNQLTNGAGYITSFDITTQTDPKYLRSNANDTTTGNITIGKADPVLILNDTSTNNTTNLQSFITFKAQGTEKGYVGFGSGSNDYLYLVNNNGRIDIQGSGGVYINNDTDISGELNVSGGSIDITSTDQAFRLYDGNNFRGGFGLTDWAGANFGDNVTDIVAYVSGSNKFIIGTNNQPRLTVDGSGNVGIGETSPSFPLDVVRSTNTGAFLTSGDAYQIGLRNSTTNTGAATSIAFGHETYDFTNFISSVRTGTGAEPKGDLVFGGRPSDGATFVERLRIKADGNVGIGNTSPSTKLHIDSVDVTSNRTSPFDVVTIEAESENLPYTGFGGGIVFKNRTYTYGMLTSARIRSRIDADSASNRGAGLVFEVTDSNQDYNPSLFLKYNGNVGIGTTSPLTKLHIEGANNNDTNDYAQLYIKGTGAYPLDIAGIVLDSAGSNQSHLRFSNNGSPKFQIRYNNGDLADDKLKFYSWTQAADIVTFDGGTGNVGIGTTSPSNTLVLRRASSGQTEHGLRLEYVEDANPTTTTSAVLVGDYGLKFKNYNSGRDFVFETGNVGIGTTNPNAQLQIDTPASNGGGQGLRINRPSAGIHYHSVEFATNGTVDWSIGQNSNDAFEVYENGAAVSTRFTIKEGGNVGIGTTSPSVRLEVASSTSNSSIRTGGIEIQSYAVNNSWIAENVYYEGGWRLRSAGYATQMYMQGGTINFLRFPTATAGTYVSPTSTMFLGNNGNVGIGTISAHNSAKLSITGEGISAYRVRTGANSELPLIIGSQHVSDSSKGLAGVYHLEQGNLGFGQAGGLVFKTSIDDATPTERLRIDSSGKIGIGIISPENRLSIGSSSSGGIDFLYDSSNGYKNQIKNYWNSSTDTRMDFNIGRTVNVAPVTVMSVGYGGNVGIGDTTPSYKLDVNGSGRFVNDLILDEDLVVADNIYLSDTNTKLTEGAGNSLRIETSTGYVDVGSMNSSYLHMQTDRPQFYFNKQLVVDTGIVESYNEDLQLRRAASSTDKLTIKDNEFEFNLAGATQAKIEPNGKFTLITSTTTKPSINSGASGTEVLNIESGDLNINSSHIYLNNNTDVDGDFYCNSELGGGTLAIDAGGTFGGNVGIGITPSAWNSIYKVLQTDVGSIASSSSYNSIYVGANVFYDASNAGKYIRSDFATLYAQDHGTHSWYTSSSGTAGDTISFVESMRIDSSGNVGIGTTSPSTQDSSANNLVIEDTAGNGGLTIKTPSNAFGSIHFSDGTGADAYRGFINYEHSTDKMDFGTATNTVLTIDGSGNLDMSAGGGNIILDSGAGIDFSDTPNTTASGATMTSELLDDYEEGTFTPSIHAGANSPTYHSNNYGKYTKIGNVVHCSGRFQVTSIQEGASSTNVEIGGFPFNCSVGLGTGTGAVAGSIGFASGFDGESPTMIQIRNNENNAFLYYQNSSLGISNLKGNDFTGGGAHTIVFQITYHTT